MSEKPIEPPPPEAAETIEKFRAEAEQPERSLPAEFLDFLLHNKKWWLIPIILALLLVAVLIMLGPAAAPFIYPL